MLIPREHGAYGQLAFPMATALAIGRPTPGAIALAVAGVAAFLGHESLLVVLGQRGGRAAREQRSEARRSLFVFGALAVGSGLAAIILLPAFVRSSLAVPILLALALAVVVASGQERTFSGEILAAVTLSAFSLPVALAAGASWTSALTISIVFALMFLVATTAVHAIIARVHGGGSRRPISGGLTLSVLLALILLVHEGLVHPIAPWAGLPVSIVALYLVGRPPSPHYLRVVGWTLVAATAATSLILGVGLH